ncbi:glycosyl transferase [Ampelomyces quisqualis]|uniref:Glycosyl transferase n=1 Tax=Ampelomyces quisqualis TaxID=50730 RepID=A0A6A5QFN9_AMPQU|nr:glycosyl transferase [Ampelomyces quisqualis]
MVKEGLVAPSFLGIQAFPTGYPSLQHWWEWTLVTIIAVSAVVGLLAALWFSYHSVRGLLKAHLKEDVLPLSVQERIHLLSGSAHNVCKKHSLPSKPTSFGVYLGMINSPVTAQEAEILSQWDAVILDYCEPGVLDAVSHDHIQLGPHIIARLDMLQILSSKPANTELDLSRVVYTVSKIIQQTLRQPNQKRYFTGVVVAGWRERLSTPLLNGLARLLRAYGLHVYLEVGPPEFLDDVEKLDIDSFSGVVVRNGTILPNGKRRDYFEMDKMKTTTKAFVSQACQRPFLTMMWDTIDDQVDLSHAVVRRAHTWCSYHGAVPYFTRRHALTSICDIRSCEQPLAAFQWLKTRRVMTVHEKYRTTRTLSPEFSSILDDYLPLQTIFPLLGSTIAGLDGAESDDDDTSSTSTLTVQYPDIDENGALLSIESSSSPVSGPEWALALKKNSENALSCCFDGTRYGSLGCFPIGLNASKLDFDRVLRSQRRLRTLKLLSKVSAQQLHAAAKSLSTYCHKESRILDSIQSSREAIADLVDALLNTTDETDDPYQLQVFSGLDSGFHTPDGGQFWGVWELESRTTTALMYLSKSVQDLTGVLLHTHLSRLGFSRYHCFLAEYGLHTVEASPSPSSRLPERFHQDLRLLSSTDLLLYLQHLQHSGWEKGCPMLELLRKECEELLIEVPTYQQLKQLSNMDYISSVITDEHLVNAKLKWYRLCNLPTLDKHNALELFRHVSETFLDILWWRDHEKLDAITAAIENLARKSETDCVTDFLLFCIFCAARKAGFEEVYIEVSDRNPLFNQYTDQSAAFAELFALGSRCEAYFDIKPSDIGVLLSKKHRDYYNQTEHQPPMWVFNAPSFASAYAAAQTDIDPAQKASVMPAFRRFTFLSVFAIPALVDIVLLSTTGHGLYLSTAMSEKEQKYATLALMSSLLLSGAIGTWISIGGTYYLISMAFSAANMFVLTRLIGGLAFTLAGCLLGFIVIALVESAGLAAVFFIYLFGLTAYLTVLAVLSTYQIPGSSFLNGRRIIIMVIPTLTISPLLTIFIWDHDRAYDIYIYPCILYVFVTLLILATRRVATQWVTWYHDIKTLNDSDIKDWYIQRHNQRESAASVNTTKSNRLSKGPRMSLAASDSVAPSSEMSFGDPEAFNGLSEPAILALCRKELYEAVVHENGRRFWQRPTADNFVKRLADCWDATSFLLDWYCRVTETKRPIPYSSTWNLETQVALESMQQSQKGIKLHNSFIHWRNAGDEIYCGILYFLVALMDRWVDLVNGGNNVGLITSEMNTTLRLSVGFGLAYYLIGAVLLDYKAQHLHTMSEQMSPISIEDIPQIRKAKANDQKFRRHLYFNTLCRFVGVHVWALALCAALIWIFNGTDVGLIMFLAYMGAYSGLLLYQYNKIFSGPHALMPLLAAVLLGFIVGNILINVMPGEFLYGKVIGLAVSTWTAAILSFRTAKLGMPDTIDFGVWFSESVGRFRPREKVLGSTGSVNLGGGHFKARVHRSSDEQYRAFAGAGSDAEFSQTELHAFCEKLKLAPKEDRFRIMPTGHPGDQITAMLLSCTHDNLSRLALQAFPTMPFLTQRVVLAWKNDLIKIFIVPMQSVVDTHTSLRAISKFSDGNLTLYVASDSGKSTSAQVNVSSNCATIAETLLHACSGTMFGMPHHQAEVTESIIASGAIEKQIYTVSECSKRSMPALLLGTEARHFETACRKELLRYLCLGYDCETQWETLPLEIRRLFLRRCIGVRAPFTNTEMAWIHVNVAAEDSCTILSRVARFDLGAYFAVNKISYFQDRGDQALNNKEYWQLNADFQESYYPVLNRSAVSFFSISTEYFRLPLAYMYHSIGTWIKFFVLACMADPEFQRELNGALIRTPLVIAKPTTFILTGLWIYSRAAMSIALPFFLYYRRKDIAGLAGTVKGSLIIQKKNRLVIRSYGDTETAFVHTLENGHFKLVFYQGVLTQEPTWGHTRITQYDRDMRITLRQEYKNVKVTNEYTYEYGTKRSSRLIQLSKFRHNRIPMSRSCIAGDDTGAKVHYNRKGHLESGSYISHGNLVRFKYHYRKNAKYDDELLRAEFVLPHMSANVSWCAPPVRHAEKTERWIPTPRVYEATFVQGADVYECTWLYDHKFHPTITTKLNGDPVETPDMIRHDWLGVLKKPTRCTFTDENPLLAFKSPTSSFMNRLFRNNIKQQEISTSRARSQLWKTWKKRNDLDGVVIRWVDEELIRKEALLQPYWRRRDRGSLLKAEDYLALHADAIMASCDLTSDISAWTPLAIRMSDLFSFGQGGDAVIFTRTKILQGDTDKNLHVIAVDTGTWPNEGGGVSACRRDLINNLRTIKWHMVVESANDFGLPKHQTEENVESLKVLPLWGLDFMHPSHGMFTNKLDSEVDHLVKEATITDIKTNFIPTLTALVRGARAINMTSADVKQATRALVNLNTYFQDSRHWKEVWTSDIVKDTWRKLWLTEDMPNAQPPSQWFRTELPTLGHFDTALDLWFRYLFIFSIPIPEKIPSVFQASHHSVSASYGIVCKIKRNCTLQIWDHAISWRETNLYLSSAMCTLPPFIRNSLLGLMKMTSTLILHHADHILPCADFFNPGWEVEIGSGKGQLTHRNVFKRKVDPIVNGITDMQKFSPVTDIKTKSPTVTMLSHVWFAKDIKTALLAADIISNEWGFKDYKLDIYGALNKSPIYSSECQEILACKGLGTSVALKGTADPAMVLADTWLFLNSSVSEGLPLALGEAALTGAPVVCTDVGASLRVLTDPDDGKRYSEVVAPNDAYGMARAQINLLAMLDEWAQYADDNGEPAPILPHKPTPRDVEIITKRMYDKTEQRRKLGMMARSIVQKSFGGERYLREHEQMLWIGKACYEMLGLEKRVPPPRNPARLLSLRNRTPRQQVTDTASSNMIDTQLAKMQHPRRPFAARHHSTATSFSSVYIDPPSGSSTYSDPIWELEEWDHDANHGTPTSSLKYPHSENSVDAWPSSKPLLTRPFKAHSRSSIPPPPPHSSHMARGKRPVHHHHYHPTGHDGSMRGERPGPPRLDPRHSLLMRQSLAAPDSGRSSLRAKSHLNEVEVAEYGGE